MIFRLLITYIFDCKKLASRITFWKFPKYFQIIYISFNVGNIDNKNLQLSTSSI